jgi:hypothetical protein
VRVRGVRMKLHEKATKKIKIRVNNFTPYDFALLTSTLRLGNHLTNPRKIRTPTVFQTRSSTPKLRQPCRVSVLLSLCYMPKPRFVQLGHMVCNPNTQQGQEGCSDRFRLRGHNQRQ